MSSSVTVELGRGWSARPRRLRRPAEAAVPFAGLSCRHRTDLGPQALAWLWHGARPLVILAVLLRLVHLVRAGFLAPDTRAALAPDRRDHAGEGYLAELGRLRMAWLQAEEHAEAAQMASLSTARAARRWLCGRLES
jgi:hypothetical protein